MEIVESTLVSCSFITYCDYNVIYNMSFKSYCIIFKYINIILDLC